MIRTPRIMNRHGNILEGVCSKAQHDRCYFLRKQSIGATAIAILPSRSGAANVHNFAFVIVGAALLICCAGMTATPLLCWHSCNFHNQGFYVVVCVVLLFFLCISPYMPQYLLRMYLYGHSRYVREYRRECFPPLLYYRTDAES